MFNEGSHFSNIHSDAQSAFAVNLSGSAPRSQARALERVALVGARHLSGVSTGGKEAADLTERGFLAHRS
jgi:hypothetical protein